MNERLALELALRRAPDSVPRRLILADFLEENGEQHAADAHRWLAAWKRRPYGGAGHAYHWYNIGPPRGEHRIQQANLPGQLYDSLAATFASRRFLAERAVIDAWPRALAAGWVPEWPPAEAPRYGPSPLRGAYAWLKAAEAVVRAPQAVPWDTPTAPTPLADVQAAHQFFNEQIAQALAATPPA